MPPEQIVPVNLPDHSYDVVVGESLLETLGDRTCTTLPGRTHCALVTDSNVAPLYADVCKRSLERAGIQVHTLVIPAGEPSKSLSQTEAICRQMTRCGLDRKAFLVALGGGVVGDLAGFASAVFFRGIPFIQIPTTIVAQVDSAVGGKTGVNIEEGKNLVGSFHQPTLVLADTTTLTSLPDREYREGFAEVIKHAAIRDAAMLPELNAARDNRSQIAPLIARNVSIKAAIVEEDEKETTGTRALLNFGHTIGHGIEAAAGYGRYLHGEAISLGTHAALHLSKKYGGLSLAESDEVVSTLDYFGLPSQLPRDIGTDAVLTALMKDKKFESGSIRFVLLRSLGDAFVSDMVTQEDLEEAVAVLR